MKLRPHRGHPLWFAFIVHRISGVVLALFLPLHFWVLSLALTDPVRLDGLLFLTDYAIVKLAEFALVFLLALHMFGGLRLLAMEWLPATSTWSHQQKTLAAAAVGVSFLISTTFFLNAV